MLVVVDLFLVVWSVVEQDLHTIRAGFFQALGRPEIEQVGKTTRQSFVVSRLFVGRQQSGTLGATLGSRQPPLGIKQDRTRVLGQNLGDIDLEFFEASIV